MSVQQEKLVVILLYSIVIGVFMGMVYDVFRIRRMVYILNLKNKEKKYKTRERIEFLIVFLEDIIYALICAVIMCIFVFYMNSGRMHAVIPFGTLLGFVLYYKTIGRAVMFCSEKIINFIRLLFAKLYQYIVCPIIKGLVFIFRYTVGSFVLKILTLIYMKRAICSAFHGFNLQIKK